MGGLVEGMNKILLGILKHMCARFGWRWICAHNWFYSPSKKLARSQLNKRILCSLQFSPKELALGLIVNTNWTDPDLAATEPSAAEMNIHMAYVEQQNLDSYAQIILHANRRKAIFDKHILKMHPKEVIFKLGDLVQVHHTDLTFTHGNDQKLIPRWSPPFCVALHIHNAYKLQMLNRSQAKGEYSAQRLRHFYLWDGT